MNKLTNKLSGANDGLKSTAKNVYGLFKDYIDNNFLKFQNEMIEHLDSYTISIDMEGVKKDEVIVQALENTVSVVVKNKNKTLKHDSSLSAVLQKNAYSQVFHMEHPIDSENTIANLYKDTLEIYLPKKTQPRDIYVIETNTESPQTKNYDPNWASKTTHII